MQTQTSFADSDSSFEFEPDRISLRSVLHRMSTIFHSYLGGGSGLSRQGSRRETPSPSASNASGNVSRQSSTRRTTGGRPAGSSQQQRHSSNRNSVLLDVLLPGSGSRRSSIWSLGTMIVSAQVHNESASMSNAPAAAAAVRRGSISSRLEMSSIIGTAPAPAGTSSPPDSSSSGISRHHSMSIAALTPPAGISSSPPVPQRPRSDVIVKLTSASKDSDLNF